MCEIFGVNAKSKVQINDYLKEFYSHSKEHPHGWGLGILDGEAFSIEKEPMQASKSRYLKERLKEPIEARNALAHIRYATIGNVEYRNCHPYTMHDHSKRRWTLIHNGTIFDYAPLNKYVGKQKGDTDSERILLYLVEKIDQMEKQCGYAPDEAERFACLDAIVTEMSKGNKLNLLIYDGELLYVHTNYPQTLHRLEKDDLCLFSTQPLSREDWQPETFTTLLAYKDGVRIMKGTNHGNEYVDKEENMKYLYSIFSDL
jgi:glutamine amidotransferase